PLAVFNSSLYVAGVFTTAGGGPASKIARWDGANWSPLGTGITGTNDSPLAMTAHLGALYVGGDLSVTGGVAVTHLARWTGTTWQAVANINAPVNSLAGFNGFTAANSFLFVGGSFTSAGGVSALHVARYNFTNNQWFAQGAGLADTCAGLFVRPTG